MHTPRAENELADVLAKAAIQGNPLPPKVFFHVTTIPSTAPDVTETSREVAIIFSEDWRSPIIAFLEERYTPKNQMEMRRLQQRCHN